ncbi:hotdog fold thioesterase [Oceanihabitans sediminis]|uniref:Medium/long-chain acyl-CoA thioesterase YigI n=1 Tax=Oceanihabitans sediminis TaxID=1812012 RepID=A0A368P875_9FLAO|nr:hotdog fold thioesterase [Oceanihabitans sediminis]MDX1278433.1 hotdog fold thioesterase [Oceanihabitans sediminis]MDX1773968.1 hotdog fold thioesterase [Oceanihabitans sediminis]RBP32006.1 uncharacterized protein (TIGR00369 family) [Oceanihabitans sediminis]RCU58666.1 hotdog fold thioesterase [Oceanihabitans sediminis]
MEDQKIAFIKSTYENTIPFHKFLGVKVELLEDNFTRVRVPFKNDLIGDFRNNRWHGGVIASVMDSLGGLVGTMHFTSLEDKLSTIDLRIDYLHGAKAKDVLVEGKIVRLGNRILVVKMKAFQDDVLIAEGKGVYNFIRMGINAD